MPCRVNIVCKNYNSCLEASRGLSSHGRVARLSLSEFKSLPAVLCRYFHLVPCTSAFPVRNRQGGPLRRGVFFPCATLLCRVVTGFHHSLSTVQSCCLYSVPRGSIKETFHQVLFSCVGFFQHGVKRKKALEHLKDRLIPSMDKERRKSKERSSIDKWRGLMKKF